MLKKKTIMPDYALSFRNCNSGFLNIAELYMMVQMSNRIWLGVPADRCAQKQVIMGTTNFGLSLANVTKIMRIKLMHTQFFLSYILLLLVHKVTAQTFQR